MGAAWDKRGKREVNAVKCIGMDKFVKIKPINMCRSCTLTNFQKVQLVDKIATEHTGREEGLRQYLDSSVSYLSGTTFAHKLQARCRHMTLLSYKKLVRKLCTVSGRITDVLEKTYSLSIQSVILFKINKFTLFT